MSDTKIFSAKGIAILIVVVVAGSLIANFISNKFLKKKEDEEVEVKPLPVVEESQILK